jgi:hypothetical protein
MTDQLNLACSVQMKVNLGNYESADCFLSISGVTQETTPAEMEALMDQGKVAYDLLRTHLAPKVADLRAKRR